MFFVFISLFLVRPTRRFGELQKKMMHLHGHPGPGSLSVYVCACLYVCTYGSKSVCVFVQFITYYLL